jgi:hypothetical protein
MQRPLGARGELLQALFRRSVMIQDHNDGDASLKVFIVYEDVVVLAHFKDQS